tara:strand:- start:639 stop:1100 length:462 start_codon:yes stop_codon:yes gene_type:complete
MGSKLKEQVKEKELSNLYLDLSEEILRNLVFDLSTKDYQNQLLFINCIENSVFYLADDIYKSFISEIESIENFNFKYKLIKLSNSSALKSIISKEIEPDGFIYQLEDSKDKLISERSKNLIISNQSNDLKKFSLILDKYKIFKELLRKILYEC